MNIDEKLCEYATDRQAEAVRAYLAHGTYAQAAKALGIDVSSCTNLIKRAKRRAAIAGYSPQHDMTKTVPDPFVVKGVSTYYDEEGKPRGQWVKTSLDSKKHLELIAEVIAELKADVKPVAPVAINEAWSQPSELMNVHILTDAHLGALSWAEETGTNWNLAIAEETIIEALQHLIERSPPAAHGFLCQLGDALHYDSMSPVTPSHHHVVDADSRPHKMVRATVRIFRKAINMLLEKHEQVTVLHAIGNHDLFSSIWLQETFAVLYENNPRCHVIVNPSPYYAVTHGKTFLGFHHGHKATMNKLVEVFSAKKYWEMKANCRMAYIHTGHQHHREVKEFNSGIVEMHQTLTAPSSYEAHSGYDADRSMTCVTYHSDGKEHSRSLYYPRAHNAKT